MDKDNCMSDSCQNNGTCIDGADTYWCKCPNSYTGDKCETGKLMPIVFT